MQLEQTKPERHKTDERNEEIRLARRKGQTYASLAKKHNVSVERIRQLYYKAERKLQKPNLCN